MRSNSSREGALYRATCRLSYIQAEQLLFLALASRAKSGPDPNLSNPLPLPTVPLTGTLPAEMALGPLEGSG